MTRFVPKAAAGVTALLAFAGTASAQEKYLGEIMWTAATFCPRGTIEASGQLVSIAQNSALFSLLGTVYGGDGRTTFALPDMRGRAPLHVGQGLGLTDRRLGSRGGAEAVTLTEAELPAHDHDVRATTDTGNTANPAGAVLANGRTARTYKIAGSAPNAALDPETVADAGGGQPHENMPPFITVRACVVAQGIYPSRN